jgi:hypothetical protein
MKDLPKEEIKAIDLVSLFPRLLANSIGFAEV